MNRGKYSCANLWRNEHSPIDRYAAPGVLLDRARNKAPADTLRPHPEWTDTDADVLLESLGGRPSLGAAPLGPIDPAKLARFVGGSPAVGAATLAWRASRTADRTMPFAATPGWVTELTATRADGAVVGYRFHSSRSRGGS